MSYQPLPKDIGGYQHVEHGLVLQNDIWVSRGSPAEFVNAESFKSAEEANEYGAKMDMRLYRKIPVAGCRDDKAMWGERVTTHADVLDKFQEAIGGKRRFYIPQDDKTRKEGALYRGLLGYFPAACFEVARHSYVSDKKHNPGSTEGPTWARSKSSDHPDCIMRHLIDSGWVPGGQPPSDEQLYHLTASTWRNLALLQEALEARGAKPGISSR
jgi:hypothetical protein